MTPAESLAGTYSAMAGAALAETHAAEAVRIAAEGTEIARSSGFDAVARATRAVSTWEGIVEIADELDAPVIVIGSRGLLGLDEAVHGMDLARVAGHRGRAVLLVSHAGK